MLAGRGARPALPAGLDEAEHAYLDAAEPMTWLAERLATTPAGGDLAETDLGLLAGRLELLGERTTSLPVIPRTVALRERLRAAGLEPLLADLAARDVAAQDVGAELELVWWTSVLEDLAVGDPRYGAHDGDLLRQVAAEFAAADREHLSAGAARVRRATAERLVATLDRFPDQAALLRAEAAKQRRHRPLRDLVVGGPDVLGAAKPCWALSPLVVSQVLPPGEQFDVVVFDEASQVPPSQAVAAISRARQVVVAGDERQLPPTAFFTSAVPDDAAAGAHADEPYTEGFESVLDALSASLPVAQLRWHYRSRDERLVSFANRHVYDGVAGHLPRGRLRTRCSRSSRSTAAGCSRPMPSRWRAPTPRWPRWCGWSSSTPAPARTSRSASSRWACGTPPGWTTRCGWRCRSTRTSRSSSPRRAASGSS